MKYRVLIVTVFLLAGCASQDKRLNKADAEHPALPVFLAYEAEVVKGAEFIELITLFVPNQRWNIKQSMGWARLAYSASHQALSQGHCETLYLTEVKPQSLRVNCEGPFTFKSAFGFQSDETMHLQTQMQKVGDEWYLGRSGLRHTMPQNDKGAATPDRTIGVKF